MREHKEEFLDFYCPLNIIKVIGSRILGEACGAYGKQRGA
jgi:hypothetical protein